MQYLHMSAGLAQDHAFPHYEIGVNEDVSKHLFLERLK